MYILWRGYYFQNAINCVQDLINIRTRISSRPPVCSYTEIFDTVLALRSARLNHVLLLQTQFFFSAFFFYRRTILYTIVLYVYHNILYTFMKKESGNISIPRLTQQISYLSFIYLNLSIFIYNKRKSYVLYMSLKTIIIMNTLTVYLMIIRYETITSQSCVMFNFYFYFLYNLKH